MKRLLRHGLRDWPNLLAVSYALLGWPAALWMLTQAQPGWNAAGVLLAAHTLIISGYLIHECAHHCVFTTGSANDRLGVLMSWINGACVANYLRLKTKHLRHHADRLDVVTFDYRSAVKAAPAWVGKSILALEWAYVPAIELLMRGMVIITPFQDGRRQDRIRVVAVVAIRVIFWTALALVSMKAVLLYALSYFLFLNVLRFMDAFQHTYEVFPSRSLEPAPADPRRNRRYEYENTYSNLLAVRWKWLNLLVLNFAYHNAHHARSGAPWYRLPTLHYALYKESDPQVLPFRALIASYHRHRVARVMADDYGSVGAAGATGTRAGNFVGAVGVSFLTSV